MLHSMTIWIISFVYIWSVGYQKKVHGVFFWRNVWQMFRDEDFGSEFFFKGTDPTKSPRSGWSGFATVALDDNEIALLLF